MKKLFLLFLIIFGSVVNAQSGSVKITGTVVDSKGLTIPGATVTSVDGSTTTGFDGVFTIMVKDTKSVLKISFMGFTTKIVEIGSNRVINVTLVEELSTLDEVVVVGYGSQKRSHVTGSVAKYQNEKMSEAAVSRVDQALQGKIAGVQITNTSSEAGSDAKINIRGAVSVLASNEPLVIVDGMQNQDGLGSLNMDDVLSVEVLKDAASSAIYGSRAANGVIIVTTKSGKSDKVKYSFKSQIGVKNVYDTYDMATFPEYMDMLADERAKGSSVTESDNDKAALYVQQVLRGGEGTDWQDEVLRTGLYKNLSLTASGGSKTVKYYTSFGYNNEEGMMINSSIEKYNLRTKLNIDLSKSVSLNINLNPQYSKKISPQVNYTDFMRFPSWVPIRHNAATAAFVNQNPNNDYSAGDYAHPSQFLNLTYPVGVAGAPVVASPWNTTSHNPMSMMLEQTDIQNDYRFQGAFDLNFKILPGLDFKTSVSGFMKFTDKIEWANTDAVSDGSVNTGMYYNNSYIDLLNENILSYRKEFGKHSFDALLGFTAQKTNTKDQLIIGTNYPTDNIQNLSNALIVVSPVSEDSDVDGSMGNNYTHGLLSYLARLNYAYNDKYLVTVSYRTDGSSYFGEGNKWGNFPAASLGWKASEESFLKEVDWLSKALFRVGYGVSGNNRIDPFLYENRLNKGTYISGTGSGSATTGLLTLTSIQSNPDITWEQTYQTNLGLDASFLRNRVSFSLDVYKSKTDRLLLNQTAMAFTGVPSQIANIGSMENKGIEFELSSTNIRNKNFKWTTSFNISHTENEIIELGGESVINSQGERTEVYQAKVGNPLVQYYGYKTDGVWLSQSQIDSYTAKGYVFATGQAEPGGLKVVDINGDKVINTNDRTAIGNPYPDFIWGLNNTFTYKAFDLGFSFQGSQGGELINGDFNYTETKKYNKAYTDNRWISEAYPGDGKTPYLANGFNAMLTDYVVEDASYVCLRDVSIGFTMPSEYVKKFSLSGLRVYLSGQNMWFYTPNYRGLNIEARTTSSEYGSSLLQGYQRGVFPSSRTVVFGLDINF